MVFYPLYLDEPPDSDLESLLLRNDEMASWARVHVRR